MRIYLSCDAKNDFFISAAKNAHDKITRSLSPGSIDLVYPPRRWGGDTGRVVSNVLQIRTADLVLMDITPTAYQIAAGKQQEVVKYNEGVLIEYGIVLYLENPADGSMAWGGKIPKPLYRIFCSSAFPRRDLTPILNTESVIEYGSGEVGLAKLSDQLEEEIRRKVDERLTVDYTSGLSPEASRGPR